MGKIKTIIFDLGGVLIDWNPRYVYKTIFNDPDKVEWFLENVCTMAWNEEQDGGRQIEIANKILIDKFPEWKTEIEAYYGRWSEMLGNANQEVVQILNSFKNNPVYRIYALTNWSAETFPIALEKFEFLKWFEGILVSGKENLKKPDPAIYELILKRYQINKENAIFIDDSLRNVNASIETGLAAIHFKSANQLKTELEKLELEIS